MELVCCNLYGISIELINSNALNFMSHPVFFHAFALFFHTEGDSVPNALTSIPERYSPQHRAGRLTQSVCVDSSPSISRYVGSPPTTSRRTSSSSSLDSSSTSRYYVDTSPSHRYVDSSLSSSPYVDSRKPDISDDNYTTLHLAPRRGEGINSSAL